MKIARIESFILGTNSSKDLLFCRVDMGVAGFVENPEEAINADIDAGWLHQRSVERVEAQRSGLDLGQQVAVGQQHWQSVVACPEATGRVSTVSGPPRCTDTLRSQTPRDQRRVVCRARVSHPERSILGGERPELRQGCRRQTALACGDPAPL